MSETTNSDNIDGRIALEFVLGANCFVDFFAQFVGPTPVSIKVDDAKTRKEQQILGLARIEGMIYPFAVELTLKALWSVLHGTSDYPKSHKLKVLFDKLPDNAIDTEDAELAKEQARDFWNRKRASNNPDTLDEFLDTVSDDFVRIRYGHYKELDGRNTHSYKLVIGAIATPLALRDTNTWQSVANT